MKPLKKALRRRTPTDIPQLSIGAVQAELLALGIRPTELVPYEPDDNGTRPKLQPHQRWDFTEYDKANSDPFLTASPLRGSTEPDSAFTIWHSQLYRHELERYVDSLSLAQLRKLVPTKADTKGRARQRNWS